MMYRLVITGFIISVMSGCIQERQRPYCKDDIVAALFSCHPVRDGDESPYVFEKICDHENILFLERMFADVEGINEADPAYFEIKASLCKKLMQGYADMFYTRDDDSEVFLCLDYDADETNSRDYDYGTLLWRWYLSYPYLYVKYDAQNHKYQEICLGFVSGAEIDGMKYNEK